MSLEEKKLELIHLVLETQEEYVLNKLKEVFGKGRDVDWATKLSEGQLSLIEMGRKDIDENRIIPHKEAKKRIKDYIKSKSR